MTVMIIPMRRETTVTVIADHVIVTLHHIARGHETLIGMTVLLSEGQGQGIEVTTTDDHDLELL
jgi:hypothetical protein